MYARLLKQDLMEDEYGETMNSARQSVDDAERIWALEEECKRLKDEQSK